MTEKHRGPSSMWRRGSVLLLAFLMAVVGTATSAVAAPPYATDATLTSLEFTETSVTAGSQARLDGKWSLPDNPTTPAGFVVDLPEGLRGLTDTFDLLDPEGTPMGTCVVSATSIACDIDDDYILANPLNLSGDFHFWAEVTTVVTESTEITYDFGEVESSITVVPAGGPCTDCEFDGLYNEKYGFYDRSDDTIYWIIDIEAPATGMTGGQTVTVLERLGPNQTLQMAGGQPRIDVLATNVLDGNGYPTDWEVVGSTHELTPEGWVTTFTTQPGWFYSLDVFVDVTDGGAAGTYTNGAEITIEGETTVAVSGEVRRQGGGGTGSGSGVGDFSINKVVDWDGQPVEGLTFTGTYTVTAPGGAVTVPNGSFSVAEGATWTSPKYAAGSTVHLEEILPSGPVGVEWSDPDFSINDFVVGDGRTTDVTLTNTATRATPAFSIVKYTNGEDANQAPGPEVEVGDTVTWTYVVTNTGNVPIRDVAVSDDQGVVVPANPSSGDTNGDRVLDVGEVWTFVATGTATRSQYRNVGTLVGTYDDDNDPSTPRVPIDPETDPSHYLGLESGLTLDKRVASVTDVNDNDLTDVGDEIVWEFELTNTGNVTLSDLKVADPLAGAMTCPSGPLAPGASVTCTADVAYVITQADVDAGSVVNVATATGDGPGGDPNDPSDDVPSNEDETETPTDSASSLQLDKKVASVTDVNDNDLTDVGDEIVWEFELTNTGNVTLTDLKVADPLAGAVTCPSGPLAPGGSVTCTADVAYVITQADVDAGSVVNVATASGEGPGGDPNDPADDVPSNEDETDTPTDREPGLELDKRVASVTDVNDNDLTDVGDEIVWEFELTNTGNVTLTDLKVADPLAGAVTCPSGPLAPGGSVTCTSDVAYVITQADVDAGAVFNVATATGEEPNGDPSDPSDDVPSNEDETETPTDSSSSLELDKRVVSVTDVNENDLTDVGDEIVWEFELTNTGNVTLTDLKVADPLAGAVTCPTGPLAPGASITCTADVAYVITQANADAGSVVNVATASGEGPGGDPKDPSDDVPSNEDETETPTDNRPELALDKRVASITDANGSELTDAGDEIVWEFELTNTGNVTLSDLKVADPLAGAVTCPSGPLAPGASVTCTADVAYVITQADADAGSVVNVATASGEGPGGDPNDPADDVPSNEDETETPTDSRPSLALDKKVAAVTDVDGSGDTDLGDEIVWEFELTNTGNVTLTDLKVADPLAGAVTCPSGPLAPGASVTCTADVAYVITQADVDAGSVVNVATASGEGPGGNPADPTDDVPSNEDETETGIVREPGLVLDKRVAKVTDVNGNGLTDAGDRIFWEFELTNTGNVTLSELRVDDPLLTAAGVDVACPVDAVTLPPGGSLVCESEDGYAITAADVRQGGVHNVATAAGEGPGGSPGLPTDVVSNEDDTQTPTDEVSAGGDEGGPSDGVLPNTGGPSTWLLAAGLLLVLLGGVVLVVGRRIQQARA